MEIYGDPGFVKHVAVAQHLGLQVLRLADSWILPVNTTHYSIELQSYLDKVEGLADKSSMQVDFHKLRRSLSELREASLRLDEEKIHAHWQLKNALRKFHHRRAMRRTLRKVYCMVRRWFGKECLREHKHKGKLGLGHCGHGREEVIRAEKHVRDVNKRLSEFEQGFISEDGIKDREWYRHLGVAPGKWLGYGATTFPALTESITIENNATQAEYEVKRLEALVDGIIQRISH